MHRCETCPGRAGLKQFLDEQLRDVDSESEFLYKQWSSTDRMSLTTVTTTCEEYKDVLIDAIDKLVKDSCLAKCKAQYLNDKKQSLHSEEALVLGDFAENSQFLIQDEIQSYHWSKYYCTFHPIAVYFKDDTGSLWHISICFALDDNSHNTCFVCEVQKTMINYLHELLPQSKSCFIFPMDVGDRIKITKTSGYTICYTNFRLYYLMYARRK